MKNKANIPVLLEDDFGLVFRLASRSVKLFRFERTPGGFYSRIEHDVIGPFETELEMLNEFAESVSNAYPESEFASWYKEKANFNRILNSENISFFAHGEGLQEGGILRFSGTK